MAIDPAVQVEVILPNFSRNIKRRNFFCLRFWTLFAPSAFESAHHAQQHSGYPIEALSSPSRSSCSANKKFVHCRLSTPYFCMFSILPPLLALFCFAIVDFWRGLMWNLTFSVAGCCASKGALWALGAREECYPWKHQFPTKMSAWRQE